MALQKAPAAARQPRCPLPKSCLPLIVLLALGCKDSKDSTAIGPFYPTAPVVTLVLTAISPSLGATGGGSVVTVSGSGFRGSGFRGMLCCNQLTEPTLLLGGTRVEDVRVLLTPGETGVLETLVFNTPAHGAGTVDLAVTKEDGATVRLVGAYTYAPTQSFDFNGDWWGMVRDGDGRSIAGLDVITIRNNELLFVRCSQDYDQETLTFSSPVSTSSGEFSSANISGRLVSATEAAGTVNLGPCLGPWFAWRVK